MMELSDHLTDPVLSTRLMDLSFSLYECLGEFLNDFIYATDSDASMDELECCYSRLNIHCMNVLGDVELLTPILTSIRKGLNAPVDQ